MMTSSEGHKTPYKKTQLDLLEIIKQKLATFLLQWTFSSASGCMNCKALSCYLTLWWSLWDQKKATHCVPLYSTTYKTIAAAQYCKLLPSNTFCINWSSPTLFWTSYWTEVLSDLPREVSLRGGRSKRPTCFTKRRKGSPIGYRTGENVRIPKKEKKTLAHESQVSKNHTETEIPNPNAKA